MNAFCRVLPSASGPRTAPAGLLALTALLVLATGPVRAQEVDDGFFRGEILLGYRFVDVDGAERKVREDLNLDDGARLFDFRIDYRPAADDREVLDHFLLDLDTYGGDSFESLRIEARSHEAWSFSYLRTKSDSFYEDLILPHGLADVRRSTGGDFHHFDFERVRDRADFDLRLNDAAELSFGFERQRKLGESTTTLDVQRDEFELEKPIDETLDRYTFALRYAWDRATLVLEEEIRDYENLYEIFLPGFSLGENTTPGGAELDYFFLDQPYDYRSNQHTVRLTARPTSDLLVTAAASLQDLELDVTADERSQGLTFTGTPTTNAVTGEGGIERDVQLFDVDVTYLLSDRVALVAGARRRDLDQDGVFRFGDAVHVGRWDLESTGAEAGLEVALGGSATVSGGALWEDRNVEHAAAEDGGPGTAESVSTEHVGVFLRGSWKPLETFSLNASVEDSSVDDPFSPTSPTDRLRIRLACRLDLGNGFFAQTSWQLQDDENDGPDGRWDARRTHSRLRLGWTGDRLRTSVAYSAVDLDREGERELPFTLYVIDYAAESDLLDASIRFRVNDRLTAGAKAFLFENDGSFALERRDLRAYVEMKLRERYLLHLTLRDVDYDEGGFDFDDYGARIAEVAVGYRW